MRTISKKVVRKTDISFMREYVVPDEQQYVNQEAGESAYRLFAHISNSWNYIRIAEIGSRNGSSAVAFSANPKNLVFAYEIEPTCVRIISEIAEKRENLEVLGYNVLEDNRIQEVLEYDVIFADIGYHEGPLERKLINYLIEHEWKGILILDDVTEVFPEMLKVWDEIPDWLPKYDLSDIGSRTGTHIVDFSGELQIV